MIKLDITKENLEKFMENIRDEDKKELIYFYRENYKEIFIKNVLLNKETTCFVADKNNNPVAIGGVVCFDHANKKLGQIWLMSTKVQKANRVSLFKIIAKKLAKYQNEYDILFNFIYKTNFRADKWLKKFNFTFKNTTNSDFKLFYLKTRKAKT